MKIPTLLLICSFLFCLAPSAAGQTVKGNDSLDLIDCMVKEAPEFQTFIKALNAADLIETLSDVGPFTILAPKNLAFTNLPYGNIKALLAPKMRDSLQQTLTYLIISGKWTPEKLEATIKERGGTLSLPTAGGKDPVEFYLEGTTLYVRDQAGKTYALPDDVSCRNGIIYPMNAMLRR